MRKKQALKTAAAALGVALLLAALPLALLQWQRAQDAALAAQPQPRALGQDELDSEAAVIPLVAALWDKAEFFDGTRYAYENEATFEALPDDGTLRAAVLTTLGDEGILPRAACAAAAESLPAEGMALPVAGVFVQRGSLLLYQDELAISASAELPKDTPVAFDYAAAAEGYVRYLGLEALGDWRTLALPPTEGRTCATLYSDKAQLMVQVQVDAYVGVDMYSCFVAPLRHSDMATWPQPQQAAASF